MFGKMKPKESRNTMTLPTCLAFSIPVICENGFAAIVLTFFAAGSSPLKPAPSWTDSMRLRGETALTAGVVARLDKAGGFR